MKSFSGIFFFSIFLITNCLQPVFSQSSGQAAVKDMLAAKRFVFEVQSASPQAGRTRQLTYGYRVSVSGDTLNSNLPYFGQSYSATISSTQSPMTFVSNSFDYAATERSKGGWDILIKIKDQSNVRSMAFTVFDDGTATLQVTSNNLQPISYRGYLDMKKQK